MGFNVSLKAIPLEQPENGPARTYLVEWDGVGPSTTALAKNAVGNYLFNVVEDQVTGEIRDLAAPPHGSPGSPGALGPTELRTRYMLHGYPVQGMPVKEIGVTGEVYEITVSYGKFDNNAQAPEPFGAVFQITGTTEASVDSSRTLSASIRAREIDYAPLRALLRRTPTLSSADPIYIPPFPVGSVNAERTSLKGRVAVNGLKLAAPEVDYTTTLTITGAYPLASWVKTVTDAAIKGTTNVDDFMIGGITRKPGEILLVSAEFEASYNTSQRIEDGEYSSNSAVIGRMNLGFALGVRKPLTVTSTSGTGYSQLYKSVPLDYIYTIDGTDPPVFYWQLPQTPPTETVEGLQVSYVSPFDYVWRFVEDEQEGDQVVSDVEWISIHRPFDSTDFNALFGTTGL